MENNEVFNAFFLAFSKYFTRWKLDTEFSHTYSNLVFRNCDKERHILFTNNFANNFKDFREIPSPKKKISIFDFSNSIIDISNRLDWRKKSPINVINKNNDTLFVGAGIQRLDWYLKDTLSAKYEDGLVFQPVIRLNSISQIDKSEYGFLTSFINLCTTETNCSIEKHIQNIDRWIYIFSKLGFHSSNLILRIDKNIWKLDKISGIKVHFLYSNLEIGDAVFLWREDNNNIASDIGFGLERLFWAYRREHDFPKLLFDKYALLLDYKEIDAIRSVILMISQGAKNENTEIGGKFKMLINRIERNKFYFGSELICSYFYNYWNFFTNSPIPLHSVNNIFNKII